MTTPHLFSVFSDSQDQTQNEAFETFPSSKPFASYAWGHYRASLVLPEPPEMRKDLELNLENAKAVYAAWLADERLYHASHIHKQLPVKTPFAQWARQKEIPKVLTYKEYRFLLEYFKRLHPDTALQYVNPDSYEHLAPIGEDAGYRKRTKVGKTYGTWQLVSLVSRNEHTKPVYYVAQCKACGHVVDKFNYSRVGQPCPNCEKLRKHSDARAEAQGSIPVKAHLKSPIVVWLTDEGWITQARPPEHPLAKLTFLTVGVPTALEVLADGQEEVKKLRTLLGTQLPQEEIEDPADEVPSEFAKTLLKSEIPDFE